MVKCPHCDEEVSYFYQISPFSDLGAKIFKPRGIMICNHCRQRFKFTSASQLILFLMICAFFGGLYIIFQTVPALSHEAKSLSLPSIIAIMIAFFAMMFIHWSLFGQSQKE